MLFLQSVQHIGAAVLRVTIGGGIPISKDARLPHDVLNPLNWTLIGTEQLVISVVRAVGGNPYSYDLVAEAGLGAGQWRLQAGDIRDVSGQSLLNQALAFAAANKQDFFSNPRDQQSAEDIVRQSMSVSDGPGWRAIISALGRGDQLVRETAEAAFHQMFLATAAGTYLERLTTSYGVDRPPDVGFTDEALSRLTMAVNANKVVTPGLDAVLEAYYGLDATRVYAQTRVAEPFPLVVGDTLVCHLDGTDLTLTLTSSDGFSVLGSAQASEVAAWLNRNFTAAGLLAYATPYVLPETGDVHLRIYSGVPGYRGRIQFFGGRIWDALRLPVEPDTTQGVGTEWDIQPSTPGSGIPSGRTRLTWTGGASPNLAAVFVGDRANIWGAPFLESNRGLYRIVETTSTWVEIEADLHPQAGVTQVTAHDIFFVRPRLAAPDSRLFAAVTRTAPDYAEIFLPATTTAVVRRLGTAWYLHGEASQSIIALSRTQGDPAVTCETATPHGLTAGDLFFLADVEPDYSWTPPALVVSSGTPFPSATLVDAVVKLADGRLMATDSARDYNLYDPATNTWGTASATGFSASASQLGLCLMTDGRVFGCLGTEARIYDPTTDVWVAAATPPRDKDHTQRSIVRLRDGRIMVVAADSVSGGTHSDVYDPATNTWSDAVTVITPDELQSGAAVVTPSGNVVLCGGDVTTGSDLAHYYNAAEGVWRPLPNMPGALSFVDALYVPQGRGGSIWVTGLASSSIQVIYTLDLATLTWDSRPTLQSYDWGTLALLGTEVVLLPQSGASLQWEIHDYADTTAVARLAADTTSPGTEQRYLAPLGDRTLVSVIGDSETGQRYRFYSDTRTLSGPGVNAQHRVDTVVSPTVITFLSSSTEALQSSGGSLTPCDASQGTRSGYAFDPKVGVTLAAAATTLSATLQRGPTETTLAVGDATVFPDAPGYIVLDFGAATQSQPIRYLGVAGTQTLRLAAGQIVTQTYAAGTSVYRVIGTGAYSPLSAATLGASYLTSTSVGRIEASKDIEFVQGAGLNLDHTVIYPGDTGLGNAGRPTAGALKLSDVIVVWGGDAVDVEAEEARR